MLKEKNEAVYMKKDFRGEIWLNVNDEIFDAMKKVNSEPVDGG